MCVSFQSKQSREVLFLVKGYLRNIHLTVMFLTLPLAPSNSSSTGKGRIAMKSICVGHAFGLLYAN